LVVSGTARRPVMSFSVISLITMGLPLLIRWEPLLLSRESDFTIPFLRS
jgi:hypothetical protein